VVEASSTGSVVPSRFRRLNGSPAVLERVLLVAIPLAGILFVLNVQNYLRIVVFSEQYVGLFLTMVLASVFMGVRATKSERTDHVPWYDWVLAAASLPAGLYLTLFYPQIVYVLGYITLERIVLGALTILLILEALRRLVGWVLVVLVALFVVYARFAYVFPGFLGTSGTSWDILLNYLYLDPNSLLYLTRIAATIGLAFILFAEVLLVFGGGKFLTDLSFALMGRFRGGPAKVAVVASSLVGTVSGGPVTNVMLTGSFTIPMMKQAGYRPAMAAAIESVASTGGQIMPPVMGIAAFIIAEFVGIPYAEVALAALIPAILYYITLFIQVDLEAAKQGLKGLPARDIPLLWPIVRKGWLYLFPLVFLVWLLFGVGYDPSTVGVLSAFVALAMVPLMREARAGFFRKLLEVLEGTGRVLLDLTVVLAGAGLVVGVMAVSGLSSNLSMALIQAGGGNLALLLVLTAAVCVVLGMGMPSVAAYALVAVFVGPALTQMDIPPLAAHLFIFYFAILSNFTPPVAIAAFAAAALAQANPMRTGFQAMRLGILAYIVPFLFVFSPTLILRGDPLAIAMAFATAACGAWLLGVALSGYLFEHLNAPIRILLALAGLSLLIPPTAMATATWIVNLGGAALAAALLVYLRAARKSVPIVHEAFTADPPK
jgi:TRAP transporter 4TM/12TM fusion protein